MPEVSNLQKNLSTGLKFGAVSILLLPVVYLGVSLGLHGRLVSIFYLAISLLGSGLNGVGIFVCFKEPSGPTLLVAFFLVLIQIAWLWTLFSSFVMAAR
jgi:hypothetical protein